MTANGLLGREQLGTDEFAALQALAERCAAHDGHGVKLNWEMIGRRTPGLTHDFCWYADGALVGYAPLDAFGQDAELTILVAPEQRRQGIGGALADAAVAEAQRRGLAELLLVVERTSTTGAAFATAHGLRFGNAEYHLELDATSPLPAASQHITMRQATADDLAALIDLMLAGFPLDDADEARQIAESDLTRAGARAYLAEIEGKPVGRISALVSDREVYLRAFSVLASYRGRGIGRALLLGTIAQLRAKGHHRFSLDVVTDNHNALGLYTSCGFREASVYDYYPWPLAR
jgi:ribosomal protein S18 acetylase RimI-like enzyme